MSPVSRQMTKADVADILLKAHEREWSIQGLGMLRTYLDEGKVQRLHVWSDEAKFEGASELHTHPWNMTSIVMAGVLEQQRFIVDALPERDEAPTHMEQTILCGEGGGLCGAPRPVLLREMHPEFYGEGGMYRQKWWEIHRSRPKNGTVTVIARDFTDDPDHAYVYWPYGEEWVTAEPRTATPEEVERVTRNALDLWF